jgi:hypothetical protein
VSFEADFVVDFMTAIFENGGHKPEVAVLERMFSGGLRTSTGTGSAKHCISTFLCRVRVRDDVLLVVCCRPKNVIG